MKNEIEKLLESWKEFEGDLRACHEYYCKHSCATLRSPEHTPRCIKLRAQHGFPTYPRVKWTPEDQACDVCQLNPVTSPDKVMDHEGKKYVCCDECYAELAVVLGRAFAKALERTR